MLGNYGVPAKYVLKWSVKRLAGKQKKTLIWAQVMKFNFVSALTLWSLILVLNVIELITPRE